ncbi:MAG: amidohydrolase [Alphaproteobacteria bacterium]|nr:MAG: amidohydrolase [Alphaproteobacteria bacterium]
MPRPKEIPAIDLMMSLPTSAGSAVMSGVGSLIRPTPEESTGDSPIGYLFKGARDRSDEAADIDAVVAQMDKHNVAIAQIPVNPKDPEGALEIFNKYPSRFIGDVSVDPNLGMEAVRALEATVKLHANIKSFTASPSFVFPQVSLDDKKWYPIYAKCIELGIPMNVFVGVPGPRVPYKGQHPELLDEIAWFFPELQIVMRHGGEPWTALCCKLMLKWPNLYYCTSAFAPKYYPRDVLDFANTRGRDKIMWTGYYPALSYDRIFDEMDDLPLRDETWEPFLQGNAARVYGIEDMLP